MQINELSDIDMAMDAAFKTEFLSVAEYLDGEESSLIRHEYVGGAIYAMAGVTREHHRIAGNLFAALHAHIGKGPCQVAISDMKLHVVSKQSEAFYYPDVMVTCDHRDTNRLANRFPKLIVEVLSDSTERTDRVEKFNSYVQIETLEEYILVAQDRAELSIYRRSNNWKAEIVLGLGSKINLESMKLTLPLADLYQGVSI